MRILLLLICSIVIGSQSLFFPPQAYSEDLSYELSGIIYLQPSYFFLKDDNFLNPDNDVLDFSAWTNRFYGRIAFNVYYDKFKFISQTRPTIFSEDGEADEFDFITDDAYLDVEFEEGYFVYVGKRNMRDVVAYGANPTDFLGENKKVDFTKREEERRVERKGNYLIGGEAFLRNITLSATYAPKLNNWQKEKDRVLLKGNYFAEDINTDMTLHLFYGDVPGVGFDISSTVSDNLVLHTENAVRWGSEKYEISAVNGVSPGAPDILKYEITKLDNDSKAYPHIVVGGSYTFGDGSNLICEYIHNGSGYNNSEWEEFTDYVKSNHNAFRDNFFPGVAMGNLAGANEIIKFREMRQNYVFVRLSNSTLIENVDGQLVFLGNADDLSYLVFPSIDYKLGANIVLGMSATVYAGQDDSEFGMLYWSSELNFVGRYYF